MYGRDHPLHITGQMPVWHACRCAAAAVSTTCVLLDIACAGCQADSLHTGFTTL